VFTAASYNIHECVGSDGRRDPDRIARVIMSLKADFLGLQEVDAQSGGEPPSAQLAYISKTTGLEAVAGPSLGQPDGRYGNALLTKHKILNVHCHDLSYRRRQPRGAIEAEVEVERRSTARVLVTHFGLSFAERRYQVRKLLAIIRRRPAPLTLLLADINEWLPGSMVIRSLDAALGQSFSRRTFPARWPLFPLDRIWICPREAPVEASVIDTFLARTASDHLPLKVKVHTPNALSESRAISALS
jgi:endonuclease/exonuclease/phosphatase family metal-dependent hydrolase